MWSLFSTPSFSFNFVIDHFGGLPCHYHNTIENDAVYLYYIVDTENLEIQTFFTTYYIKTGDADKRAY